jgi:hypothetical protein
MRANILIGALLNAFHFATNTLFPDKTFHPSLYNTS